MLTNLYYLSYPFTPKTLPLFTFVINIFKNIDKI